MEHLFCFFSIFLAYRILWIVLFAELRKTLWRRVKRIKKGIAARFLIKGDRAAVLISIKYVADTKKA